MDRTSNWFCCLIVILTFRSLILVCYDGISLAFLHLVAKFVTFPAITPKGLVFGVLIFLVSI